MMLQTNGFPRHGGIVTEDYYPQVYGNNDGKDTLNHAYCNHKGGVCVHASYGSFGSAKITDPKTGKSPLEGLLLNNGIDDLVIINGKTINKNTGKEFTKNSLYSKAVDSVTNNSISKTNNSNYLTLLLIAVSAFLIIKN